MKERVRMKVRVQIFAALLLPLVAFAAPASAETPEQWIALLTRVHGGFGSFLPVGIRIGEDALGGVVL